jgi:hypothetical protein
MTRYIACGLVAITFGSLAFAAFQIVDTIIPIKIACASMSAFVGVSLCRLVWRCP